MRDSNDAEAAPSDPILDEEDLTPEADDEPTQAPDQPEGSAVGGGQLTAAVLDEIGDYDFDEVAASLQRAADAAKDFKFKLAPADLSRLKRRDGTNLTATPRAKKVGRNRRAAKAAAASRRRNR